MRSSRSSRAGIRDSRRRSPADQSTTPLRARLRNCILCDKALRHAGPVIRTVLRSRWRAALRLAHLDRVLRPLPVGVCLLRQLHRRLPPARDATRETRLAPRLMDEAERQRWTDMSLLRVGCTLTSTCRTRRHETPRPWRPVTIGNLHQGALGGVCAWQVLGQGLGRRHRLLASADHAPFADCDNRRPQESAPRGRGAVALVHGLYVV